MARIAFMKTFPDGTNTYFREQIMAITIPATFGINKKIHTIRQSAYLQRFIKKELECFCWEGKPYRSKQEVFATITLDGFQFFKAVAPANKYFVYPKIWIDDKKMYSEKAKQIILNDGITAEQFNNHFFKKETVFNGFIYHFTNLRY